MFISIDDIMRRNRITEINSQETT